MSKTPTYVKYSIAAQRVGRTLRAAGMALLTLLAPSLVGCGPEGRLLERRVEALEAKQEIESIVHRFARAVDQADPTALRTLAPVIHEDFRMDVTDFLGQEVRFDGYDELVQGFGQVIVAVAPNVATSAIMTEVDGTHATALFKFINSVQPPPALGLNLGIEDKVLLFAEVKATFLREAEVWKLYSLRVVHSLAYPGSLAAFDE